MSKQNNTVACCECDSKFERLPSTIQAHRPKSDEVGYWCAPCAEIAYVKQYYPWALNDPRSRYYQGN